MTIEASKILLENARKDFSAWKKEIAEIKSIGILYTTWYPEVMEALRATARDFFAALEIPESKIDQIKVSGSWELPLAVKTYIDQKQPDLVIALGCVIKGETPHFDILCQAVASQLMTLQVSEKVPLGFGVLTVNSLDQAQARHDKGAEAAEAALRSWIQLKALSKGKW